MLEPCKALLSGDKTAVSWAKTMATEKLKALGSHLKEKWAELLVGGLVLVGLWKLFDLNASVSGLASKTDGISKPLEKNIDGINNTLETKIDSVNKTLEAKFEGFGTTQKTKTDGMDTRLGNVETQLKDAAANSLRLEKDVAVMNERTSRIAQDITAIRDSIAKLRVGLEDQIIKTWVLTTNAFKEKDKWSTKVIILDGRALSKVIYFPLKDNNDSVFMARMIGAVESLDSGAISFDRFPSPPTKTMQKELLWAKCSFGLKDTPELLAERLIEVIGSSPTQEKQLFTVTPKTYREFLEIVRKSPETFGLGGK